MTILIEEVSRIKKLDGKTKLLCQTHRDNDGSIWECNPDGTDWVKVELGINDLQESLNKHLNETKAN